MRRTVLLAIISLLFCYGVVVIGENDSSNEDIDWLQNVNILIHRNGEADPCGVSMLGKSKSLSNSTEVSDKYQMESFLTSVITETIEDEASCSSRDDETNTEGLLSFCDMGPDHTPILLDYPKLIRVAAGSLPCRWYTREGIRITSVNQFKDMVKTSKNAISETCKDEQGPLCENEVSEFHLYAVQAGRVFMFAPAYVGEIFDLSHLEIKPYPTQNVFMKVLSVNPRVFDLVNIFSKDEAAEIVQRALKETSPSHKLHRSLTGSNENSVFSKRTSENAFDTHGKTAMAIKKRIFELLGYDEFLHGHDDGLQVLRYNLTKAYVDHMDYLRDKSGKQLFNYDSSGKGGNRFATVLLYMSDMDEDSGGETVFTRAWPSDVEPNDRVSLDTAIQLLRESGDATAAGIEPGSWEEKLVARCRSRLAVQPRQGRAILFYSQLPNGKEDTMSKHGGCPVLKGEKWAANLWVWNTPRSERMQGAPLREDLPAEGYKPPESNAPKGLHATFRNTGKDPRFSTAELWYDESMFWGPIGSLDPPLKVVTYEGHRWNIRVDGEIVKRFEIGSDAEHVYEI